MIHYRKNEENPKPGLNICFNRYFTTWILYLRFMKKLRLITVGYMLYVGWKRKGKGGYGICLDKYREENDSVSLNPIKGSCQKIFSM